MRRTPRKYTHPLQEVVVFHAFSALPLLVREENDIGLVIFRTVFEILRFSVSPCNVDSSTTVLTYVDHADNLTCCRMQKVEASTEELCCKIKSKGDLAL